MNPHGGIAARVGGSVPALGRLTFRRFRSSPVVGRSSENGFRSSPDGRRSSESGGRSSPDGCRSSESSGRSSPDGRRSSESRDRSAESSGRSSASGDRSAESSGGSSASSDRSAESKGRTSQSIDRSSDDGYRSSPDVFRSTADGLPLSGTRPSEPHELRHVVAHASPSSRRRFGRGAGRATRARCGTPRCSPSRRETAGTGRRSRSSRRRRRSSPARWSSRCRADVVLLDVLVLVVALGALVRERARGLELRREVDELVLPVLALDDRLAERLAVAPVLRWPPRACSRRPRRRSCRR